MYDTFDHGSNGNRCLSCVFAAQPQWSYLNLVYLEEICVPMKGSRKESRAMARGGWGEFRGLMR